MRSLNKSKNDIFYEWSKYVFGVDPPYEKDLKIGKCQRINYDECNFLKIHTFPLKKYNLFFQNNESSLEQWKWNFAFMKVNNLIATKLCVKLLWKRSKNWNILSARQNSMTKLFLAWFKCGNKLEISWEI